MYIGICVPTKNRSELLEGLLFFIEKLNCDIFNVMVVDSSDIEFHKNQNVSIINSHKLNIDYFWTPVSSTSAQRNIGLKHLMKMSNIDFILFLDDDTYPDQNYVQQLLNSFESLGSDFIGGMGIDTNHTYNHSKFIEFLKRIALFSSKYKGKILKSGHCSQPYDGKNHNVIEVEWLWSCSLWKKSAINNLFFPEIYDGYVLGEDILFSIKARERGKLFCNPKAQLAQIARGNQKVLTNDLIRKSLKLRLILRQTYYGIETKSIWYIWNSICELLYYLFIHIFRLNFPRLNFILLLKDYFIFFRNVILY